MAVTELLNEDDVIFAEHRATGVVLMDFYASWCQPCKKLGVELEKLQEESPVPIWKVEVENHPLMASQFGVMSVPTVVIVSDGEVLHMSSGFKTKEQLLELINKYV